MIEIVIILDIYWNARGGNRNKRFLRPRFNIFNGNYELYYSTYTRRQSVYTVISGAPADYYLSWIRAAKSDSKWRPCGNKKWRGTLNDGRQISHRIRIGAPIVVIRVRDNLRSCVSETKLFRVHKINRYNLRRINCPGNVDDRN